MASHKDYLEYVLELLKEVKDISYKKMMGEFLLYKKDVLFGGIYDNRFLVKKTRLVSSLNLKEVIPYPNAKAMLLIDSEDPDEIRIIVLKVYRDLTENWTRADLKDINDKDIKSLADKGNKSCIFEYGLRLYDLDQYEESFKYLYQLVDIDNSFIWERIINIAYEHIPGILTDEELFRLLLKRHEKGSSYYSYILSYFYREGRGCKKDLTKYNELLRICSNDGSMSATYELAGNYEKGYGVIQSYEEAFKIYYYWLDDHGRKDYWCAYKAAYYMYHEIGGAKKDLGQIEYLLVYASRVYQEARDLYKEIFNKEIEK